MRKTSKTLTLSFGLLLGLAFPALAQQEARELDIEYRRDRRPETPTGAESDRTRMPSELRLEEPEGDFEERRAPRHREDDDDDGEGRGRGKIDAIRDHVEPPAEEDGPSDAEIEEDARRAAAWAARELARHRGRREYYRAGFYRGFHDALGDSFLGRRDHREGLDAGRRDPDAYEHGGDLGYASARRLADEAAAETVAAQWHDLSREPRRDPGAGNWHYRPELPLIPEPGIEGLIRTYPLERHVRGRDVGPLPDPWEFYRCRRWKDVFDERWRRPGEAFEHWRDRGEKSSLWRRLDRDDRSYFERAFEHHFPRYLARERRDLERSWDVGASDGWSYGAFLHAELDYRLGYRHGFLETLEVSAERAFDRHYPAVYEASYQRYFDDWASSARPEIGPLRLDDASGDGVVEPGEEVLVYWELVNYGGQALEAEAYLDSPVLASTARAPITVPRRTVSASREPLRARIDPTTRPKTQTRLELAIAGRVETLPLRIAYPLELEPGIELLGQESLTGRAALGVMVVNRSSRPAAGRLEWRARGGGEVAATEIGPLAPGGEYGLSLEVEGLEALDLLGGEAEAHLVLYRGETLWDELSYRFPERATDLTSRELTELLVAFARDPETSRREIERAHALVLRRLEADWRAAVAADGNPYRRDLRKGTRETALGDLVASYETARRGLAHPEVFTALAPRIRDLAKTLPGTHPFLRGAVKRLARRLEG